LNLAFVFPGQGSQSVGMQADLPDTYKVARETYDEASNVLGFDLLDLVANGPAQTLDDTVNTQPAMVTRCGLNDTITAAAMAADMGRKKIPERKVKGTNSALNKACV